MDVDSAIAGAKDLVERVKQALVPWPRPEPDPKRGWAARIGAAALIQAALHDDRVHRVAALAWPLRERREVATRILAAARGPDDAEKVAVLLNLVDPRLDLARGLRDLAPALADQDAARALVALAVPRGALGLGDAADPVHVLGDSLRRARREPEDELRLRLCFAGQLRALSAPLVDEANVLRVADACVVGAAAALAGANGDDDKLQRLLDSAMGDEERRAVARDGVAEHLGQYLAGRVPEGDAALGIRKLLVAVDQEFLRVPAPWIAESLAQLGNQRAPTLVAECAVAAASMPGACTPGPLGIDASLDVAAAANRVSKGR